MRTSSTLLSGWLSGLPSGLSAASLVVASLAPLVACSGGDDGVGHLPDAPLGPQDAPTDASPTAVTLTVTANGAPIASVHTYFINADGSTAATVDTDAHGTASAIVTAGGSVTAIDPFASVVQQGIQSDDLRTFLGVKPGDQLVLTQNDPPAIMVTIIAPQFDGAVTSYTVFTTCGEGQLQPPQPQGSGARPHAVANTVSGDLLLFGCGGTTDIVVVANDNEAGAIQSLYHANVPVMDGHTVDLTADSYAPIAMVTFSYTNVPDTVGSINVSHTLATAHGVFDIPLSDGGGLDGGTASFTLREPTIAGGIGIVDTQLTMNAQHDVIDVGPVTATYMLDPTGVLLPDITTAPSYDIANKRVTWVEADGGATADLSFLTFAVTRNATENTAARNWQWAVAGPHSAGQLGIPTLPTDVFDWTPQASDSVTADFVVNAKVPGGYDAVRARIHDIEDGTDLFAGTSGRIVTAQVTPRSNAVRRRH